MRPPRQRRPAGLHRPGRAEPGSTSTSRASASSSGLIAVTLYADDSQPLPRPARLALRRPGAGAAPARPGSASTCRAPGTYALGVYHDADGDRSFNRNGVGPAGGRLRLLEQSAGDRSACPRSARCASSVPRDDMTTRGQAALSVTQRFGQRAAPARRRRRRASARRSTSSVARLPRSASRWTPSDRLPPAARARDRLGQRRRGAEQAGVDRVEPLERLADADDRAVRRRSRPWSRRPCRAADWRGRGRPPASARAGAAPRSAARDDGRDRTDGRTSSADSRRRSPRRRRAPNGRWAGPSRRRARSRSRSRAQRRRGRPRPAPPHGRSPR